MSHLAGKKGSAHQLVGQESQERTIEVDHHRQSESIAPETPCQKSNHHVTKPSQTINWCSVQSPETRPSQTTSITWIRTAAHEFYTPVPCHTRIQHPQSGSVQARNQGSIPAPCSCEHFEDPGDLSNHTPRNSSASQEWRRVSSTHPPLRHLQRRGWCHSAPPHPLWPPSLQLQPRDGDDARELQNRRLKDRRL